jgi:hypothetical protein
MRESQFKKTMVEHLRRAGYRVTPWPGGPHGEAGVPDLHIHKAWGFHGWIEAKMAKNNLSKHQARWIDAATEAGELVVIARHFPDDPKFTSLLLAGTDEKMWAYNYEDIPEHIEALAREKRQYEES